MYHGLLSQVVTPVRLPCPKCHKGTLRAAPEVVWYRGVRLGRFVVETCTACGAQVVDETNGRAVDRAFERAKAAGSLTPKGNVRPPSKTGRLRSTAGPSPAARAFSRRKGR